MFVDLKNKEIIIDKAYLKYEIDDCLNIIKINNPNQKLINFCLLIAYFNNLKAVKNETIIDLKDYLFGQNELKIEDIIFKRLVRIGDLKTGFNNTICDVDEVLIGEMEIKDDKYQTGLTTVFPHPRNMYNEKVVGAAYVFNGYGKSAGLIQIEELGQIETPIVMTSTLNVGKIMDGLLDEVLEQNPNVTSINSIVMECNDGYLNDSRDKPLGKNHLLKTFENRKKEFKQGDFGAGAGMTCHGFKGGIGSSSRIININGVEYTLGIILNSNFGSSNGAELIFNGRRLSPYIEKYSEEYLDKGSIVGVFATDIELDSRQLKRVLKRIELGIARTGSYAGNGSGDVFVGFSTKNKITKPFNANIKRFNDDDINIVFKAVVEMSEEAVLNSMLFAHTIIKENKIRKGLLEYLPIFDDLLDIEIEKK